jgi:hypothetical protein
MPRFAILEHQSPRGLHWDLLLEMGEKLRTWALAAAPEANARIPCQALPDHRLAYLDYEGPVSGGRGSVVRWDQGVFEIESQSDNELALSISGSKIQGRAVLSRLPDESESWSFIFQSN